MSCVIFGAGKIARGFIGHLLYLSEIPFVFVEKSEKLCDLINEKGQYTVNVLGNSDKNTVVKGVRALNYAQREAIIKAISQADVVFNAVGGKNLREIIPYYAEGIRRKSTVGGYLNFVTCENWKEPAAILRAGIEKLLPESDRGFFQEYVGITEAVIMRSAIEASPELLAQDPLIVNVQDYWELPVDASRVRGVLPPIRGLKLLQEFSGFLERKFYTYNAANGTVSYLGALLGYTYISDAAHDKRILEILDGVYNETSCALCKKYGYTKEEQLSFVMGSKRKLQNCDIIDYVERNARDPLRKLGPDDRLVGSARMVYAFGIMPENLCTAIAAAIYYQNDADEYAVKLTEMRTERGVDYVIGQVCKISPDGDLGKMIKQKINLLKNKGYIHE